ncbi:CUE domain protein Cue1/4 family involved in ER associated protein catabolism predicted [Gigaspora margarita]|uniref:CUE domain protein Cue1/4 family involved in ER associated protein catabolism predicted n=1 Tax=Gigaspora margarita TaxID=4874 RepID=A0A8H4A4F6_GIGMA|nr:CUE domain protein Cue1/4 family involved in ER associated protein catabolism predicted [Gigaspora margarita]
MTMNDGISILVAIVVIVCVFRWLLGSTPQHAPRNRRGNFLANDPPRTRPRPVTPEMVATVCAMFPNIPPVAVQYDLQKTGSVEVTCDNILQHGGLPLPPPTVASSFAIPSTSHASSSSTTSGINVPVTHQSLVDRYKLQDAVKKGIVPPDPPKTWESTPERRQELLQMKKDAMILQARERYLQKQPKKQNETQTKVKNHFDDSSSIFTLSTHSLTHNSQTNLNNDEQNL